MKYRFYSPVQGIIDYDFNKDMDYDSYFDEYNMEELEEIDFEHLAAEDIVDYQREINQAIRKEWDYETDEDMIATFKKLSLLRIIKYIRK